MNEPEISVRLNADWENMSDETKAALAEMIRLAVEWVQSDEFKAQRWLRDHDGIALESEAGDG